MQSSTFLGPLNMKNYMTSMISTKPYNNTWHKIRKIDGRNKLYGEFDYQIQIPTHAFLEVRMWCWETWGPSIEYYWYNDYKRSYACNSSWCFDTDFSDSKFGSAGRRRGGVGKIYLAGDQELDLFYLKWKNK